MKRTGEANLQKETTAVRNAGEQKQTTVEQGHKNFCYLGTNNSPLPPEICTHIFNYCADTPESLYALSRTNQFLGNSINEFKDKILTKNSTPLSGGKDHKFTPYLWPNFKTDNNEIPASYFLHALKNQNLTKQNSTILILIGHYITFFNKHLKNHINNKVDPGLKLEELETYYNSIKSNQPCGDLQRIIFFKTLKIYFCKFISGKKIQSNLTRAQEFGKLKTLILHLSKNKSNTFVSTIIIEIKRHLYLQLENEESTNPLEKLDILKLFIYHNLIINQDDEQNFSHCLIKRIKETPLDNVQYEYLCSLKMLMLKKLVNPNEIPILLGKDIIKILSNDPSPPNLNNHNLAILIIIQYTMPLAAVDANKTTIFEMTKDETTFLQNYAFSNINNQNLYWPLIIYWLLQHEIINLNTDEVIATKNTTITILKRFRLFQISTVTLFTNLLALLQKQQLITINNNERSSITNTMLTNLQAKTDSSQLYLLISQLFVTGLLKMDADNASLLKNLITEQLKNHQLEPQQLNILNGLINHIMYQKLLKLNAKEALLFKTHFIKQLESPAPILTNRCKVIYSLRYLLEQKYIELNTSDITLFKVYMQSKTDNSDESHCLQLDALYCLSLSPLTNPQELYKLISLECMQFAKKQFIDEPNVQDTPYWRTLPKFYELFLDHPDAEIRKLAVEISLCIQSQIIWPNEDEIDSFDIKDIRPRFLHAK